VWFLLGSWAPRTQADWRRSLALSVFIHFPAVPSVTPAAFASSPAHLRLSSHPASRIRVVACREIGVPNSAAPTRWQARWQPQAQGAAMSEPRVHVCHRDRPVTASASLTPRPRPTAACFNFRRPSPHSLLRREAKPATCSCKCAGRPAITAAPPHGTPRNSRNHSG
jgi:hypothetical protein